MVLGPAKKHPADGIFRRNRANSPIGKPGVRSRHFGAARALWLVMGPLLVAGLSTLARAQSAPSVILPELPFTERQGTYARASGMGFAHTAVVEDASSLLINPAGLAQVRRLEFSGGLLYNHLSQDVAFNTNYGGFSGTGTASNTSTVSAAQLSHLTLAYPFPTYRGSLVLGVGYQRVASLKSDYFRAGFLTPQAGSIDGLVERESFNESGGVNYWTTGIGGDLSAHLSVGASVSYIQGHTRQDFQIGRLRSRNGVLDVNGSDLVFQSREIRDADLNGWTGSAGILGQVSEIVRVGANVNFPQKYTFQGALDTVLEDQEKVDRHDFLFEDKITLPLSLTAGVAVMPKNFLLAADLKATDWTQIDFQGEVVDRDRQYAYRSTVDMNLGAEFQLPGRPTRFRAGFASHPLPYRIIPAGIAFTFVPDDGNPNTTDDTSYFVRDYPRAALDTDRRYITLGAGTLIDETLMLDVAWIHGMYERSGGGFSEKWSTDRVLATTTFRF